MEQPASPAAPRAKSGLVRIFEVWLFRARWLMAPFYLGLVLALVALLYVFAAAQIRFFARQIGSFRTITCLLYPFPLIFFFVIFARSAIRRATHRPTSWRGRKV